MVGIAERETARLRGLLLRLRDPLAGSLPVGRPRDFHHELALARVFGYRRRRRLRMVVPPAGVDAGTLAEAIIAAPERRSSVSDLFPIRRSFVMRTFQSPDLPVLRSEVAARLGLARPRRTTPRSSRSAATYLADLRWPGGVECPRCSETSRPPLARSPARSGTATRAATSSASPPARSSTARTCPSGSGSSPST